jgi:hypothetical protein
LLSSVLPFLGLCVDFHASLVPATELAAAGSKGDSSGASYSGEHISSQFDGWFFFFCPLFERFAATCK